MGDHRAERKERRTPPVGHGHGHGHGGAADGDGAVELEVDPLPRNLLLALLVVVAAGTILAAVLLWPDGAKADKIKGSVGFSAAGVTYPAATVESVQPACPVKDGSQTEAKDCGHLTATVDDGASKGTRAEVDVPPEVSAAGLSAGDRVELVRTPGQDGQPASLNYFGIERGHSLWLLSGLFALVALAVARLRGLMAIIGLGVAAVVIAEFLLPALLTGESPVAVAVAAAVAIMYVVLFSTHGISVRTCAALAGTLGGILVTALVGWWAVGSAHLTGVTGESGGLLTTFASGLHFQDLLVATVVIAGLGVLNDVTITQASAVWELRAASPAMSRPQLFASAMRIGRDHIASTIYTIVFAYAGTALTLLLVISLYDRPWFDLVGTEEIAEEIVRSLTGSIGLILAVPITTVIAVLTVPGPREAWLQSD